MVGVSTTILCVIQLNWLTILRTQPLLRVSSRPSQLNVTKSLHNNPQCPLLLALPESNEHMPTRPQPVIGIYCAHTGMPHADNQRHTFQLGHSH